MKKINKWRDVNHNQQVKMEKRKPIWLNKWTSTIKQSK